MATLLQELIRHPVFRKQMEELRVKLRPVVKLYDPKDESSVEKWKHDCASVKGFDMLYDSIMNMRSPDE